MLINTLIFEQNYHDIVQLHNHTALKSIKNQFSISMYRHLRSLHRYTYSEIQFLKNCFSMHRCIYRMYRYTRHLYTLGIDASIVCIDTMTIFTYLASTHNSLHRYLLLSSVLNAFFSLSCIDTSTNHIISSLITSSHLSSKTPKPVANPNPLIFSLTQTW